MKTSLRVRTLITAFAIGALTAGGAAMAQSESEHAHGQGASGMGQGMGGMTGMMQGCPMMRGAGGGRGQGMAHLPPGNEKLEMQMHADMMRAMADIMTKYAARLPDKK